MEYRVEISEQLCRTVSIEANSRAEACRIARRQYRDCQVVLDSDDFVGVDFNATPLFYRSRNRDFTLLHGDCRKLLREFDFKFDMVFADPPYFLSNGGISVQSGRVVCVDKGEWDKGKSQEEVDRFNTEWIAACREKMRDNATIWISGTYHNIFSVANDLRRHIPDLQFVNPLEGMAGEGEPAEQLPF